MISTMDMTTGQWEIDGTTLDVRGASGDANPHLVAYMAHPTLHAGLREYAAESLLHARMSVEMAALDLDEFLARMGGSAG